MRRVVAYYIYKRFKNQKNIEKQLRPKVVAVVYDFPAAFGFNCVLKRFKRSGRLRELVACGGSTVLSITFDR